MLEGSVMDAAGSVGAIIGQGLGSVSGLAVKGHRGPRCAQRWRVEGRQVDCRFRGLLVLARRPRNTFCRRVILAMSIAGILNLTA